MPLSAALCEQGASPSLSQGCRSITPLSIAQVNCLSVDIVTIYQKCEQRCHVLVDSEQFSTLFGTALMALFGDGFISLSCHVFALLNNIVCSFHTRRHFCVLYPVAVPHRVGTHPGHVYSRRVAAAAGFTTHNMAGPSNMTTSTLGDMSFASSRHRTMSDLVPSFSFHLADTDGGHG